MVANVCLLLNSGQPLMLSPLTGVSASKKGPRAATLRPKSQLTPAIDCSKFPGHRISRAPTNIPIGYALSRLVVPLVERSGSDAPEIVIPSYIGKTGVVD